MQRARKLAFTAVCLIVGACSSAIENESTTSSSEALTTCINPTSGMVITTNTTLCAGTFTMNTPAGAAAVSIGADNVTVTCNQTVLQGPGASGANAIPNVGLNVVGRKAVTLKGCTAKGFQYGAVVKNSSAVTLDSVHLDDNFTDAAAGWVQDGEQGGGVRIESTTSSTVKNSTFSRNWNGIELRSSSSITVTGNTANPTTNVGLLMFASINNTVTNNDFSNAIRGTYGFGDITFDSAGILLDVGSSGNLIQGNKAKNGGDGIFIRGLLGPCATNNRVIGNDASNSPNNGIESWCDNNVFSNNIANNCNYGIWLGASDSLTVTGNTAAYNNTDGISIQGGSDRHGLIQDNILKNNMNAGLFLAGAHNADETLYNSSHLLVQRNTFTANFSYDIFAEWTRDLVMASNCLTASKVVIDAGTTAFVDTIGNFSGAAGRTPPTAVLANPPATVGMNTNITFDASASVPSSSGGTLAYRWLIQAAGESFVPGQFPAVVLGGISNAKPTVQFTRPGNYDIDVTVTDGLLGSLANRGITVLPSGTRVGETAATWTYQCSDPNDTCGTTTFVDEAGGLEGTDVHVNTNALFDFAAVTPAARNLGFNASGLHYLGFYVKAKDTNVGTWQPPHAGLPIVVLGGPSGTLSYEPSTVLLPSDGTTWVYIEVPLTGGSGWTRSDGGGSLSLVNWIEIHADTWGSGFDLWFDTVTFY